MTSTAIQDITVINDSTVIVITQSEIFLLRDNKMVKEKSMHFYYYKEEIEA